MTHEKVEKQGRDNLSHKTALHTVWLARTIVQHINFYLAATIVIPYSYIALIMLDDVGYICWM